VRPLQRLLSQGEECIIMHETTTRALSKARRHIENAARHSDPARNAELQHSLQESARQLRLAAVLVSRATRQLAREVEEVLNASA